MKERQCALCGATFQPLSGPAKYCGGCRKAARRGDKRRYREKNRERVLAADRSRAKTPKAKALKRKWAAANKERTRASRRAAKRAAYQNHPEKFRQEARKHYEKNPEKYRARSKSYREANRDKCRKARREAYDSSESLSLAYVQAARVRAKRWYAANKLRAAASANRRRARLRDAKSPGVTLAEWASICEQFSVGGVVYCAYCHREASQVDHVRAISRGGADAPDNVVPACAPCNASKKDKVLLWQWVGRGIKSARLEVA